MRIALIFASTFIISGISFSQKNLYLGFEAGASYDQYELFDNGNQILKAPLLSGSLGINLSYPLSDYFSVETGVIGKPYVKGFDILEVGRGVGFTSQGIQSVQIPFRLRSRLPIIQDRLYISTVIGYHYCFNLFKGPSGGSISASNPTTEFFVLDYTFSGNFVRNFSLLETGVGLELKVLRTAFLRFSATYFKGFTKLSQTDMVYSVNGGPDTNATMYSKGDYVSYNLGIRFPIATIWKKQN